MSQNGPFMRTWWPAAHHRTNIGPMSDLRVVLRRLLRSPLSSAAIVLTLGIGLGAATAIYSVAHALLLRPLPFPDADRIVAIDVEAGGGRGKLALREIRELEKRRGSSRASAPTT
jgi:hypothetical protein